IAESATPASVTLFTFRTRTEPPTPTKPPAAAPAMPKILRTSFAITLTLPPAWMVVGLPLLESIVAVVPPVGVWATALVATLPPTLVLAVLIFPCGPTRAPAMREFVFDWLSAFVHRVVWVFGSLPMSAPLMFVSAWYLAGPFPSRAS